MGMMFANNAVSALTVALTTSATTITVGATDAANFPQPAGPLDYFMVTVEDLNTTPVTREICKCTARTGNLLTVVRAQEGFAAAAFATGTATVTNRLTARSMRLALMTPPDNEIYGVTLVGSDAALVAIPAGATGPAGPVGPIGPAGPKGDQGVPGQTGPQGSQGQQGNTGDPGPAGTQGVKGDTGATGPAGPIGPVGPTSTVPGPQGPQGVKGDPGTPGATGPAGPAGPPGADGSGGSGGVPEAPLDGAIYGRGGATPAWVQALPLTGGTMTGPFYLYADPISPTEGATKQYVDAAIGAIAPSVTVMEYNSKSGTTAADPGKGNVAFNTANQYDATAIYIDTVSQAGRDWTAFLLTLQTGQQVTIQMITDHSRVARWTLTGPVVNNTGWMTIPVTPMGTASGFPLGNSTNVAIAVLGLTGGYYLPLTGGTLAGPLTVNGAVTTNTVYSPGTTALSLGTTASGEAVRINDPGASGFKGGRIDVAFNPPVNTWTVGPTASYNLNIATTGSGTIAFASNGGAQFRIGTVASAVNNLTASGSVGTNSPALAATGTATNLDVVLTPKGTGTVRSTSGGVTVNGATSGAVTLAAQAAAGTWNFNLPVSAGTAGQVLTSAGGAAAPMTWTTPASGGGGVPEAPTDGQLYARGGATPAWTPALPLAGGQTAGALGVGRSLPPGLNAGSSFLAVYDSVFNGALGFNVYYASGWKFYTDGGAALMQFDPSASPPAMTMYIANSTGVANGAATLTQVYSFNTSRVFALSGPLKLGNAYTAGAVTPTGYITIQDSTGTTYKIPVSL